MSSWSKLTFTSITVTNRSANCCISARSLTASGGSDSQKAPIRSRMASPPKPSITQKRALRPATYRSRYTMSQLRPAPSTSSNPGYFPHNWMRSDPCSTSVIPASMRGGAAAYPSRKIQKVILSFKIPSSFQKTVKKAAHPGRMRRLCPPAICRRQHMLTASSPAPGAASAGGAASRSTVPPPRRSPPEAAATPSRRPGPPPSSPAC